MYRSAFVCLSPVTLSRNFPFSVWHLNNKQCLRHKASCWVVYVRGCVCVWRGYFKSLEGKRCLEKEAMSLQGPTVS